MNDILYQIYIAILWISAGIQIGLLIGEIIYHHKKRKKLCYLKKVNI